MQLSDYYTVKLYLTKKKTKCTKFAKYGTTLQNIPITNGNVFAIKNYYTVQNVANKKGNTNNRIRQIWNKKSRKWVTNKWTENRITQAVSAKKERTAKKRKKEVVLASGYLIGTARNFKKYQISRILAAVRYGSNHYNFI